MIVFYAEDREAGKLEGKAMNVCCVAPYSLVRLINPHKCLMHDIENASTFAEAGLATSYTPNGSLVRRLGVQKKIALASTFDEAISAYNSATHNGQSGRRELPDAAVQKMIEFATTQDEIETVLAYYAKKSSTRELAKQKKI